MYTQYYLWVFPGVVISKVKLNLNVMNNYVINLQFMYIALLTANRKLVLRPALWVIRKRDSDCDLASNRAC